MCDGRAASARVLDLRLPSRQARRRSALMRCLSRYEEQLRQQSAPFVAFRKILTGQPGGCRVTMTGMCSASELARSALWNESFRLRWMTVPSCTDAGRVEISTEPLGPFVSLR